MTGCGLLRETGAVLDWALADLVVAIFGMVST